MESYRLGSSTTTEANSTAATPIWETPECPCLLTRVSFEVSEIRIAGDGVASVVVEFQWTFVKNQFGTEFDHAVKCLEGLWRCGPTWE